MQAPTLGQIVHYVSKNEDMTVHAAIVVMTPAEWTPTLHAPEHNRPVEDWLIMPTEIPEPGTIEVHLLVFGAGSVYWECNVPQLAQDSALAGDLKPRTWFWPPAPAP